MKTAKKFISVFLCISLLISLLSGCETEQDRLYSQAMSQMDEMREESSAAPDGGEENAEQITLTVRVPDDVVDAYENKYGKIFTEQNPNIKIEAIGFSFQDDPNLEKLSVEILAGEAGDIVMSSFLSTSKLAESGAFVSLDEYFEAMPDFSWEDYYTNILDAIRYQGELYLIPHGCGFNNVRLKTEVAEALNFEVKDEISLSEVIDLKLASQEIDSLPSPMYLPMHANLLQWELAGWIDEESRTASLDTPEFIDLLKRMKQADRGRVHGMSAGDTVRLREDEFCGFAGLQYASEGDSQKYLDNIGSEVLTPSMQLTAGDGGKVFSSITFSVTSACTEREAAAKFLRFLMDDELMLRPDEFITNATFPVNRNTNLAVLEYYFGSENTEIIEQFDYWCSQLDTLDMIFRNGNLYDALIEISDQYFNDLITAEECARQMQERAWIYLNE